MLSPYVKSEQIYARDAITPSALMEQGYLRNSGLPEAAVQENIRRFPFLVKTMAQEERVEFLDLRAAWKESLRSSSQPAAWYMRDAIYSNSCGKQVVGHVLVRYLELAN